MLSTAVEGGVCPVAVGCGGVGTLEAAWSGVPSPAGEVSSVLGVCPSVTMGDLGLAVKLPVVTMTGEVVTMAIFVLLKTFIICFTDAFLLAKLCDVSLRTEGPGSWRRPSDKDKEETQMSTRTVHILQVNWEQGRALSRAPSNCFSGC